MKRTTYILIGMLFSVLLLLVGGVIYVSTQGEDRNFQTLTFSDKMVTTELTEIRAVKFYATDSCYFFMDRGGINIVPSTDGKTRISNPESDCLKVFQEGDTLVVYLDMSKQKLPQQKSEHILATLRVEGLQITIEGGDKLAYLSNSIFGMDTKMSGLHLDSLDLYVRSGSVRLDSCSMQTLRVDGDEVNFNAFKSDIPNLYLDLDGINNWTVDECNIDTEHLTGSGKHRNSLQKGECKQVLWTPKTEESELSVTFAEKGRVVIQPE